LLEPGDQALRDHARLTTLHEHIDPKPPQAGGRDGHVEFHPRFELGPLLVVQDRVGHLFDLTRLQRGHLQGVCDALDLSMQVRPDPHQGKPVALGRIAWVIVRA
jgi:hypothetical protein